MNNSEINVLERVKEVLSEVSTGISQSRVALAEAKEEIAELVIRLERAEVVAKHNLTVTEDNVLSEMRAKEEEAHPAG